MEHSTSSKKSNLIFKVHHIIPVQLLKENKVVQMAVEGGFKFNLPEANGLPLSKFVKKTGKGRHGPHPEYTKQIKARLDSWALSKNFNYSAKDAQEFLEVITDDIKYVINDPANASTKINALKLGL